MRIKNKMNKKKLKIGLDYDDVIPDTIPSFVNFHNQRYGTRLRFEDIKSYWLWELGIGKDKPEAMRLFQEYYASPEFDEMPLVPGAQQGVLELASLSDGCLEIVTSRPLMFRVKTIGLLRTRFPATPSTVHHSNDFHDGEGASFSKATICQELGLDYFVEDCLAYAETIAQRRVNVLLLRKPWNERDWSRLRKLNGDNQNQNNPQNHITPVESWQELLEHIKGGYE
nr:hypothetical protein [uncultured archaeon]AQS32552.1 hypothetical protein [uncultured archaeon]AQS33077.1 hypothetical protein [uncultured archaeon]